MCLRQRNYIYYIAAAGMFLSSDIFATVLFVLRVRLCVFLIRLIIEYDFPDHSLPPFGGVDLGVAAISAFHRKTASSI